MPNAQRNLERELRALSNCHRTLLRANDEAKLLEDICRIVCDDAGYHMAWVGYPQTDAEKSVRVVASAGEGTEYLARAAIVWADTPRGQGPTGIALRTGETAHTRDAVGDQRISVWHEIAVEAHVASGIALPLKDVAGEMFGALTIYSEVAGAFSAQEVELLEDLAADLAFGVRMLRGRAQKARAEVALHESQETFAKAFSNSPVVGIITDLDDLRYVEVNKAWEEHTGHARDEVIGRPIAETDILDLPAARQLVRQLREEGSVSGFPVTWTDTAGKTHSGVDNSVAIEINGKQLAIHQALDVTEWLDAELALKASERMFSAVFHTSPDAIAVTRLSDGLFIDVNDAYTTMLGYGRDEVVGHTVAEIGVWAAPDDRQRLVDDLAAHDMVSKSVATFRRKDASLMTAQLSARIVDLDGTRCLISIVRDITAERRAELELHASRERLRATIDEAAIGIAQLALDGRFIDANDRMCQFVGYTAEELRTMTFADITHPDERDRHLGALKSLSLGNMDHYDTEKRYVTKDGAVVSAHISSSLARDRDGNPDYIVTVVQDVTERKVAEDALAHSSRALRALSGVNEALVRATSEDELLGNVCDVITGQGYALAWVGYAVMDERKTVQPIAWSGDSSTYLDGIDVTWADEPRGQGPAGQVIRDGKTIVAKHLETSAEFAPWRDAAAGYGFRATLTLPLKAPDDTVFGALCIYSRDADAFDADEVALLTEMGDDLSYGIESLKSRTSRVVAESQLRTANQRLQSVLREITATMGKIVEARDPYTQGHQQGVSRLACLIAAEMGLPPETCEAIEAASLVHDVGKLSVPAEILNKPGKLIDMEFEIIKGHSLTGYEILRDIDFEWPVADIVLQHHERMDGSGYPNGLVGDEILMPARVVAAADVIEAIASHRPYRPSLGIEVAMEELRDNPTKYDPDVTAACLRLYEADKLGL